ncbi:hypothetical protein ACI65C_002867 [Semiaphis heraclei]
MPKCVVKTRKLQNHGLFIEYGVNENFSIKVWQMLSLAFLLKDEIPDAFKEMKEIKIFPDNANYFVQCLSGLRIIIHILLLLWRQCGFRVDGYNLQLISAGTAGRKCIYFYCRYLVFVYYMGYDPLAAKDGRKCVNIVKAGRVISSKTSSSTVCCRITQAAFTSETGAHPLTGRGRSLPQLSAGPLRGFALYVFFRHVPHRPRTALFRSTAAVVKMDATVGHRPAYNHRRHNTGDGLGDEQLVYGRQRRQDNGRQKEPLIFVGYNTSCC